MSAGSGSHRCCAETIAGMHRILTLAVAVAFASGCSSANVRSPRGVIEGTTVGPSVRTDTRPDLPQLAKRHTADGAVAFARYYFGSSAGLCGPTTGGRSGN